MTNRFNRSRLGETIVSIVLETHKREEIEIPPHFIHEIKTKSYYVIDAKVFSKKVNSVLTILLTQKYAIYKKRVQQMNSKES